MDDIQDVTNKMIIFFVENWRKSKNNFSNSELLVMTQFTIRRPSTGQIPENFFL